MSSEQLGLDGNPVGEPYEVTITETTKGKDPENLRAVTHRETYGPYRLRAHGFLHALTESESEHEANEEAQEVSYRVRRV